MGPHPETTHDTPNANPTKSRDTIIGSVFMLVVGLVLLVKCLPSVKPESSDRSAATATPAPTVNPSAVRDELLVAMRRKNPTFWRDKATAMKYGASEDWAVAVFGKPHADIRDGTGRHRYIWAGGGAVLHAVFLNSKCVSYQILDERDIKAMKLEGE